MFSSCKAILLFTSFLIGCTIAHGNVNKSLITEKVFGGQVATDKYRWSVANIVEYEDLSEEIISICTGSILGKKWILTAAHCFYSENSNEISAEKFGAVPATENTAITTQGWNTYGIGARKIFVHNNYDNRYQTVPNARLYDIAVIELESEIIGTGFQPVRLGKDPSPLTKVMAVGYGSKKADGPTPKKLQMTPLIVQSKDWCQSDLEEEYARDMICSISENYLTGSSATNGLCSGDSGGPIFSIEDSGNLLQYGVYSFGDDPCQVPDGVNYHVSAGKHKSSINAIMNTGSHSSFEILYESSDVDYEPNESEEEKAACFPANAKVKLENGTFTQISALNIGDRVLVAPNMYSDIIMFTHQEKYSINKFIELKTENSSIRLSPGHNIYLSGKIKAASEAIIGDSLFMDNSRTEKVVSVKVVRDIGLFNPQTMHGDIYINGVRSSTFTEIIEPNTGNALLSVFRALYVVGSEEILRYVSNRF